ncbi:MAG: ATP synthase F1 subunit gamma [Clostridia bacterium]|nr:ATP synthase F1 subunit gamma [Clostridia bacterium]
MESISELKQHLRATAETRQIANAMYLLSASRVKRLLKETEYTRSYARKWREIMAPIVQSDPETIPKTSLFRERPDLPALVLVISSDKGLCGAYHTGVTGATIEALRSMKNPQITVVGEKAAQMLRAKGQALTKVIGNAAKERPAVLAKTLAQDILTAYENGDCGEVFIIFTEYINTMVQRPVCKRILPFSPADWKDGETADNEWILEPDTMTVLETLTSGYLTGVLTDLLTQSAASENTARMAAMQNATKNADEMLERLNTQIHTARQLAITNEITEIAAAAEIGGAV